MALKEKDLGRLFDGLRAPRFISFHFEDYAASVIGEDLSRLQQFACRFSQQCPSLQAIEELKRAFTLWERQSTLCTIMAVLIAGFNLKKESSWPLGHVVLLPGQNAPQLAPPERRTIHVIFADPILVAMECVPVSSSSDLKQDVRSCVRSVKIQKLYETFVVSHQ